MIYYDCLIKGWKVEKLFKKLFWDSCLIYKADTLLSVTRSVQRLERFTPIKIDKLILRHSISQDQFFTRWSNGKLSSSSSESLNAIVASAHIALMIDMKIMNYSSLSSAC